MNATRKLTDADLERLLEGEVGETDAPAPSRACLLCLADVEPEPHRFLWVPRIPLGKLTLVEGDGGTGKTQLTCAIAAAVSCGHAPGLPAAVPIDRPLTVLMLNSEDGAADTLRPRLEAMGAALRRIHLLTGILTEGGELPLMLDSDGLQELERAIVDTGARVVTIDPILQHLGARVDVFRPNEVRAILAPLMAMAHRHSVAIILIRHLNKGAGNNPVYRGQGSQDFYSAARSVLLVGLDPGDPHQSVIIHTKCNYAAKAPALAFSVRDGIFGWIGETDMTAHDLLNAAPVAHNEVLQLFDDATRQPLTAQTLVEALDMKPDAARQRLVRMHRAGQLVKISHGAYVPKHAQDGHERDNRQPVTPSQMSHSERATA